LKSGIQLKKYITKIRLDETGYEGIYFLRTRNSILIKTVEDENGYLLNGSGKTLSAILQDGKYP
jgi:hypothetical protein